MIQHLDYLLKVSELVAVEKALILQGAKKDTTDLEKWSAELKNTKAEFLKTYGNFQTIADDQTHSIYINENYEQ